MISPPPSLFKLVSDDIKADATWKTWLDQVHRNITYSQSGSETLASGTASVTFTGDEPTTSYSILLAGDANETFYWASKATTGFTINSSNGTSTANVDWVIIRN